MKFSKSNLEKRVHNLDQNILKVKQKVKEVYQCQINPDYSNNKLTDMRSKLTELEVRKNYVRMTTAQKMKFSIEEFFSRCDQIPRKLWNWSYLLKKS